MSRQLLALLVLSFSPLFGMQRSQSHKSGLDLTQTFESLPVYDFTQIDNARKFIKNSKVAADYIVMCKKINSIDCALSEANTDMKKVRESLNQLRLSKVPTKILNKLATPFCHDLKTTKKNMQSLRYEWCLLEIQRRMSLAELHEECAKLDNTYFASYEDALEALNMCAKNE